MLRGIPGLFKRDTVTSIKWPKTDYETQNDVVSHKTIPAPPYLKDDEWFGPAVLSEENKDYMERETEIKRQEFEKNFSVESEDIHQKMYEFATKSVSFQGGSENIEL